MITRIIAICILLFAKISWAGGSFVGNGAGLVENNFQYAYISLNHIFSDCLESHHCELNGAELTLLKKMKLVLTTNLNKTDRLIFVSGAQIPDFFKTGENEDHRIAKTGLTSKDPIYINTDCIYDSSGAPAIDFPTIISILTHEIGHQAGEPNHALLDIIGSKIKKVMSQRLVQHQIEFGSDHQQIEILILNNDFPLKSSKIFFSWQNVGSSQLTTDLMQYLRCSEPGSTMSGFEMYNGHYFLSAQNTIENPVIGFGLWITLNCYSGRDNSTRIEKSSIDFEVNQSLEINLVDVKRLD
jgi:hypothetical protein